MKGNTKLGAVLAVLGILTGFLVLFLLASTYMPIVEGKILDGRPDEAITVRIVHALLGWAGMAAGALWVAVLYGFLTKKEWAWGWGVVAATAQILAGFFPMIPAASIRMPTPTIWVFLIAFALWFGMLFIGGVKKQIIALAFVSGLAYVLTFIDGVGSISRYQTSDNSFAIGMYAMGQMINWLGAIVWAVFIYALVKGKTWAYPVGLFAASMSIFGGYPVGLTDIFQIGRFSMFLVAPVMSTGLLAYLLLPGTRKMLEKWAAG
ncbi:MAG: Uncharacterized protein FD146_2353 [Anaerolineaceae bacterium]|nr:MAG: Uncharacterized protein FD146_2353 [Anaerolineaceae bacterium]